MTQDQIYTSYYINDYGTLFIYVSDDPDESGAVLAEISDCQDMTKQEIEDLIEEVLHERM